MSHFKTLALLAFIVSVQTAFASLCEDAHDQAAVRCTQTDYSFSKAADGYEERSATASAAATTIGLAFARCDAAVTACKTLCRKEYERAVEDGDTSKLDEIGEFSINCARGSIADAHAMILSDKIYSNNLAQTAEAQRSVAATNEKGHQSERMNSISTGMTSPPSPLLGTLIGL